jgi:hypothetical protein
MLVARLEDRMIINTLTAKDVSLNGVENGLRTAEQTVAHP